MDGKMKNMMMAGMMGLCLVLGVVGVLGETWIVPTGDDAEEMEDAGSTMSQGLTAVHGEIDLTKFMGGMLEGECDAFLKEMEDGNDGGEYSCADDDTMVINMPFSDTCDEKVDDDEGSSQEDVDDACAQATGGMIGTIGMWAGIVCALVCTLMFVLPMAGVDAMDAVPDMGKMIATWGAGALMLIGMLVWYLMLPDSDMESTLGLSGYLAGAAMTIGLGAAATGQFIPSDE
jgi:hypothetical protein